jgi:hypothetical protein
MSSEEFSGIGFAAGVVRGTRSFAVDKLGRLTGVSYKQVWTPGENEAICRREDEGQFGLSWSQMARQITYTLNVSSPSYYSTAIGSGAYASGGVIETTTPAKRSGVDAVLGTSPHTAVAAEEAAARVEAERAEKARLEAEKKARDTLADCSHGFYGYYDGSNDYYKQGYVMGVVEGYGETVIGTRGFRCMKARIVAIRIPKHVPDRLRAMILRNYPDVPVFDTFKAMVAEFPADDAGVGVSPETDPDFWTRAI